MMISIMMMIIMMVMIVVLGDKDHHKPVLHLAMLPHMLSLSCLLLTPDMLLHHHHHHLQWQRNRRNRLSSADATKRVSFTSLALGVAVIIIIAASLLFGVKSHPFLLADNR
jgi:hypothetical protein